MAFVSCLQVLSYSRGGSTLLVASFSEDHVMPFVSCLQVLRYSRGGSPLWVASLSEEPVIPNCHCGAERQFEFQVPEYSSLGVINTYRNRAKESIIQVSNSRFLMD